MTYFLYQLTCIKSLRMLTHVKLVTFSLKTMAYNCRIKTLLFFLLFIIQVCANAGEKESKRYIEDEQPGNLYEQNGHPTTNEETLLDKIITTIMKERAMEKLKETIMQEINQEITKLKVTIENQNIVIDQLAQKMTEKDKIIDKLDSRLRLHEESHERMTQGIYSIPPNPMPQESPQESNQRMFQEIQKNSNEKMPLQIYKHSQNDQPNTNRNNDLEDQIATTANTSNGMVQETNSFNGIHRSISERTIRSQSPGSLTRVAFSVYLSEHVVKETDLDNFIIKFDGITLNEGSMYNKYTGVFTTPVSGVYHFNFHISAAWDGLIYPTLMKNGQKVVSSYLNPQGFTLNGSNSVLVYLNTGDSLWVQIFADPPTGVELKSEPDIRATTFSGFLLHQ
ncbi:uncharacterized protein LOC132713047 [Ruditapes philippinarum]|uniref:uncharacterized protein LOC132713047 n=1 Tax=Ruditapes philippinarum TaxID=129788 RepID=UPI00295B81C9|nr:uncharacterized protein LOC132713047 [Ruditapes philippinarum]